MTTELDNLLAVYREVDRGLAADPRNVPAVAEVLPPYADGAAAGWVDTVERWANTRSRASVPVILPEVDDALAALAATPPTPGLEARRALALDALTRARPERFGPRGSARELVDEALPSPSADPQISSEVIVAGTGRRETGRAGIGVVIPGIDVELEQALAAMDLILDPGRWPELLPDCWTGMTPLDRAHADEPCVPLGFDVFRRYEEEFHVTDWLQLTPVLVFRRSELVPAGEGCTQVLEYHLVEGGANDDELVQRDSGSLLAHFTGGTLRVRTTKRVRFRPPFDGPGLTLFASALGYLDASLLMVQKAIAKTAPAGARHGDTDR
jgi:hypothetical protein